MYIEVQAYYKIIMCLYLRRLPWFNLFVFLNSIGVYGDVQRVKILYNKKDSALVQLAEPHQAHLG